MWAFLSRIQVGAQNTSALSDCHVQWRTSSSFGFRTKIVRNYKEKEVSSQADNSRASKTTYTKK
jgi:hypothetical protein